MRAMTLIQFIVYDRVQFGLTHTEKKMSSETPDHLRLVGRFDATQPNEKNTIHNFINNNFQSQLMSIFSEFSAVL